MTKTWKLEDAKTHLSQLIRDAENEPQVITRHGKPVAVVTPVGRPPAPMTALTALLGDFDFSDAPDDDLFGRDRTTDARDLEL